MKKVLASLVIFGVIQSQAAAHPVPVVIYHLEFHDNGDDDGVLEPGEKMEGVVYAEFIPRTDQPILYTSLNGTKIPCKVEGYGYGDINIINVENGLTGDMGFWEVDPFQSTTPYKAIGGSIFEYDFVQQVGYTHPLFNHDDPAHVIQMEWHADGNFVPRKVSYQIQINNSSIRLSALAPPFFQYSFYPKNFIDSPVVSFWVGSKPCAADCDGSGSLTIDDFICYQTLFAIGDPLGDCDGDGVLLIDDFICFQTAFAIGC